MNYIFFDTDLLTENEDYTIEDSDYEELLRVCFAYADYFSIWFSPHVQWTDKLKPYEITVDPSCFEYAPPSRLGRLCIGGIAMDLHFYRTCPELYQILIENTHSVWDGWNYEQPAFKHFYRSDGTCFLMSHEHEGKCYLYLREDEDASSVVGQGHWHRETDLWPKAVWSPRPREYRDSPKTSDS